MFTNVVVEPTENSPPVLECAYTECFEEFPFEQSKTFCWFDGEQLVYAGFCCYVCALNAMNPQVMWRA